MKWATLIVFALLLGIAVGGWTPRERVRQIKEELKLARSGTGSSEARSHDLGAGITGLLQIPEATPQKTQATPEAPLEDGVTATNAAAAPPVASPSPRPRRPRREGDLQKRIDAAGEVWRLRSELARDQFLERVAASDEQGLQFQVLIEAMNLRIGESIDRWAAVLRSEEAPSGEVMVRMMNDVTTALATTYDELDGTLTEDWRAQDGEALSLTDFIDPDVATPLIGLEDQLERR